MADTVDRIQVELEVGADTSRMEREIRATIKKMQKEINLSLYGSSATGGNTTTGSQAKKDSKNLAATKKNTDDLVHANKTGKSGKSGANSDSKNNTFVAAEEARTSFERAMEKVNDAFKTVENSKALKDNGEAIKKINQKIASARKMLEKNNIITKEAPTGYAASRSKKMSELIEKQKGLHRVKESINAEYERGGVNRDQFNYAKNENLRTMVSPFVQFGKKFTDAMKLVGYTFGAKYQRKQTNKLIHNEASRLKKPSETYDSKKEWAGRLQYQIKPLQETRDQLTQITNQIDEYNAKLEEAKKKLFDQEQEYKRLRDAAEEAVKNNDPNAATLQEQVQQAGANRDATAEEATQLSSKLEELKTKHSELNAEVNRTDGKYARLQVRLSQAQAAVEESKAKLDEEQRAVQESATKYVSLRQKISDIIKKYKELNKVRRENNKESKKGTQHTNKAGKAMGKFADRLKRILLYKIINGLINAVTSSLKEGTKNLYLYSKAMKLTFADTMDKYATKLQTMKNAIGSICGQLIEIAMPIILKIIQGVTTLGNEIARVIALMRGEKYFSKAVDVQKEWNTELSNTKKLISGFDELNIFSKDNNQSDYSKMFVETETGSFKKPNWFSNFKLDNIFDIDSIKSTWSKLIEDIKAKWKENMPGIIKDLQDAFGKIDLTSFINSISSVINLLNTVILSVLQIAAHFWTVAANCEFTQSIIEKIVGIAQKITEKVNEIIEKLTPYINRFTDNVLPGILQLVDSIMETVDIIVDSVLILVGDGEWLGELIDGIGSVLSFLLPLISNINTLLNGSLKPVLSWVADTINTVLYLIGGISSLLFGIFSLDWNMCLRGLESLGRGVAAGIAGIFDGIINAVISALNVIIGVWNSLTNKKVEKLQFVSMANLIIKSNSFGAGQPSTSTSSSHSTSYGSSNNGGGNVRGKAVINAFATGGVITSPTTALLGEYSGAGRNPEIVAPQNILRDTFESSNGTVVAALAQLGKQVVNAIAEKDLEVSIGDKDILQAAYRGNLAYMRSTGAPLI